MNTLCGIIAISSDDNIIPLLKKGLKRLEYRGYDSVGIALKYSDSVKVYKRAGNVEHFLSKLPRKLTPCKIGIAHNRWATHGAVTDGNAHPHMSNNGKLFIVHNGIVENYEELKQFLSQKGYTLKTPVDTEVIVNLIEYQLKSTNDMVLAIQKACKTIRGNFAFVIMSKNESILYGARRGSPLVAGIGKNANYLASDIPAFLDYTNRVIYIPDNSVIEIDDDILIYSIEGGIKGRKIEPETIEWKNTEVSKGKDDEYYMIKEILQQSETIWDTYKKQDITNITNVTRTLKFATSVILTGAGSSYHACVIGSYMFHRLGIPSMTMLASEIPLHVGIINKKTLIVGVSQSGETADVLEAVKIAKSKKARVLAVTNSKASSLARLADYTVYLHTGPEIGVLSTKTYTAELVIFTYLSSMINKTQIDRDLKYLSTIIYQLTSPSIRDTIKQLAKSLKDVNHIYTIGRGYCYGTAMEAALKIKEVSYIHCEAFAGGELKHGTLSLIDKDTPVIVFIDDETKDKTLSNAEEVKTRGARVIGVSDTRYPVFDEWIKTPSNHFIVQIIPIQLLSYELAILKGLNPDMPRNLAKSITVP